MAKEMPPTMNKIRKLRSKTKAYAKIIEVNVPVRFYWSNEGYDGFEIGSLDGCSKYQLRLLNRVINQLAYEHDCAMIATFMEATHKQEWRDLLDRIESEAHGIPRAFFDAFKEKQNE